MQKRYLIQMLLVTLGFGVIAAVIALSVDPPDYSSQSSAQPAGASPRAEAIPADAEKPPADICAVKASPPHIHRRACPLQSGSRVPN